MSMNKKLISGLMAGLLVISTSLVAKDISKQTRVSPQGLINAYGFDSWNLEKSKCHKISKAMTKRFKFCINQGTRKTFEGQYTQFKCKKADKSEVLIYKTRNICAKQYHSMYLESF